ncbi:MAG TPA: DUF1049 domain-containing protein [Burkholderiales bacterium]|nr:DUF1049 domain-containing protein [Burkholderiales bacterium]
MRYVCIALIVLFTAMVLLFKFQNLEAVTVSFLSMSASLPVPLLVTGVYVLGMLTGGFVPASVRDLAQGATRPRE